MAYNVNNNAYTKKLNELKALRQRNQDKQEELMQTQKVAQNIATAYVASQKQKDMIQKSATDVLIEELADAHSQTEALKASIVQDKLADATARVHAIVHNNNLFGDESSSGRTQTLSIGGASSSALASSAAGSVVTMTVTAPQGTGASATVTFTKEQLEEALSLLSSSSDVVDVAGGSSTPTGHPDL